MNKPYRIVSVGRSLVDVVFTLEADEYERARIYLDVAPGDWTEIRSEEQLKEVFKSVAGIGYPFSAPDMVRLEESGKVRFIAGSTNLNVFSVFPEALRKNSAILTAVGKQANGEPDGMSVFFTNSLKKKYIDHLFCPYAGSNPLSLVFVSRTNPEKIMASFLGISGSLDQWPSLDTEYIYLDAYELMKGPIAALLDRLISSGEYKIALGLGNVKILEGRLAEQIRDYLRKGKIHILLGNIHEYKKLASFRDMEEIPFLPLFSAVPYSLLTQGAAGLAGIFDRHIYFQESFPISRLQNTTGAGDTAAGAFIAGLLRGARPADILRDAAEKACEYLKGK